MRGTVTVGTAETDDKFGTARNWRVHLTHMRVIGQATFPVRVFGPPRPLGDGNW